MSLKSSIGLLNRRENTPIGLILPRRPQRLIDTKMLYIGTLSNPVLKVCDVEATAKLNDPVPPEAIIGGRGPTRIDGERLDPFQPQ